MYDYSKYLLRTPEAMLAFSIAYANWIEHTAPIYAHWVNEELPMNDQWFTIERNTERETQMVIGLLCWLYDEGEINIQFNEYAYAIRKMPRNNEEYKNWNKTKK